ncbi:MAG: 50S ribosomal protein L21 [Acidobacteria bacterium]|nr:50S ribosomal protein L21 [Acidobacteriota bacterium]
MQAIIESGGKQYRVAPGDLIRVEKIPGEVGSEVALGRVLALFGEDGALAPAAGEVKGTITRNGKAKKVLVFKFKRKKQYKRTIGHRQEFTEVRVSGIYGA